jgi:hypothetical protein
MPQRDMSQEVKNRIELERRIAEASHMSKPDAENALVIRDADGRWIFEVYLAGHTVESASC